MCRFILYIFIFGSLASGCSKIGPADDGFVSCTVETRIDNKVKWRKGCYQDEQALAFIECAIGSEVTADIVIQIALLNNPKIQATFEELGISQADVVEAGLLSNPSFEIEVRYPYAKHLYTNIEYLLTSSLLDIFLIPLRSRLASTEFEQTKLRVSNEILNIAFDVRETYYELLAEEKKMLFLQSIVDLTSISSSLFTKQFEVGNVNTLEFQLAQSRFWEAELEFEQSQAEIIRLREKLNRLLGFPEDFYLIIPKNFHEEADYQGFDLCALESIALEKRLDLQIARFEIVRISQMLGLKNGWTYTNLKAGLAGEREPDGANLIGPGFSGELPIFNYGQAARMRLFAQLRQAQDRLTELEINILSKVREAHKLLMNYAKIINKYENRLLPIQSQILMSSEELYNVMGLGVDRLLTNKLEEFVVYKNYIESMKKFLVARVELDRALGGYLFKLTQNECSLRNAP